MRQLQPSPIEDLDVEFQEFGEAPEEGIFAMRRTMRVPNPQVVDTFDALVLLQPGQDILYLSPVFGCQVPRSDRRPLGYGDIDESQRGLETNRRGG